MTRTAARLAGQFASEAQDVAVTRLQRGPLQSRAPRALLFHCWEELQAQRPIAGALPSAKPAGSPPGPWLFSSAITCASPSPSPAAQNHTRPLSRFSFLSWLHFSFFLKSDRGTGEGVSLGPRAPGNKGETIPFSLPLSPWKM